MTQKECRRCGEVLFAAFVVAAVLSGCSMFASTTPRSEILVERWSVDDHGNAMKLNSATMRGEWMEGEFQLQLSQGFVDADGRELMTTQTLAINNVSLRPEAALKVALERARVSRDVSVEALQALEKTAALFAVP